MLWGADGETVTTTLFTALESAKNECDDGVTQLSSGAFAFEKCGASLRAWLVPKYRKAISRKIINFFIVLNLIITIVYLYYISHYDLQQDTPRPLGWLLRASLALVFWVWS